MQCFKRWKSLPHHVDSSEFDLCSRWRPCKGSSQLPLLWAVCSRSGRRCTRTMGLGGTCGCLWAKIMTHSFCIFISNLWLPLGKKNITCEFGASSCQGKNVYSLFSAWDTCVLFLSIYSAHKQGKKEERAKESHFLLIFEESKSVRRYDAVSDLMHNWGPQRPDFKSALRVVKMVLNTQCYQYLWLSMWFHAKKLKETLKNSKSLILQCKFGSRAQKWPKIAQKTDH